MKLRLLLSKQCNRNCEGCCNKDFDLDKLPVVTDYSGYDEIILTGGEPMLRPNFIREMVRRIRKQTLVPIYLYTAKVDRLQSALAVLGIIDGICVTLHEQSDVEAFHKLENAIDYSLGKSLRVNIFKGVKIFIDHLQWKVKSGIEWIKNCPLPKDEIFARVEEKI